MTTLNQSDKSNFDKNDFWQTVKINIKNKRQKSEIKPILEKVDIPLSYAQEYLWFLNQESSQNMNVNFFLLGNLNVSILQKSLQEIVDRHDILRTFFTVKNRKIIQEVLPEFKVFLPLISLENLSESQQKEEIKKIITENKLSFFDLNKAPLWRCKLAEVSPKKYFFSLVLSHVIWDVWSNQIFKEELIKIYQAFVNNEPHNLPKLTIQYADYTYWQRQDFQEKLYSKQKKYWKKQLKGNLSSVNLPVDFSDVSYLNKTGKSEYIILDEKLTKAIKEFSQKQKVSLFVTLLASFQLLLYCYSGQEDFVICSSIASRNQKEIKNLLGYFNNILPLRIKLTNNSTFTDVINLVSQTYLQALENQDFPFHHIAKFPHLSRTSLSKVMFSFLNTPQKTLTMGDIQIEEWQKTIEVSPDLIKKIDFDLFLVLRESDGLLRGILSYKKDLFKQETIVKMRQNWQSLLQIIVSNPDVSLNDLPSFNNLNTTKINSFNVVEKKDSINTSIVLPQTPLQEKILQIWQEVLRIKSIGIEDNFFVLGGHSISATQVNSRICQTLNIELPVNYLFKAPTIKELSLEIEKLFSQNFSNNKSQIIYPQKLNSYPASFVQKRFWFFYKLEPNSAVDNLKKVFQLNELVNPKTVEKTINIIIQRHEILRTNLAINNNSLQQIVSQKWSLELPVIDITNYSEEERENKLRLLITEIENKPFNLASDLMIRAVLFRCKKEEYILLLITHHIASDKWSLDILSYEFVEIYTSLKQEKCHSLPELPIQYGDFSLWQQQAFKSENIQKQLQYWKQKLAGKIPILNLPYDRLRPVVKSYDASSKKWLLPSQLVSKVKQICQQEKITLFMFFLTVFKILLFRYSQEEDILIGVPITGRKKVETEKLIGCFLNTLVLRTNLSNNPTARELLRQVKLACLEAYENQDLPFEKLIEELQPERNLSVSPLFQVMFNMLNTPEFSSKFESFTPQNLHFQKEKIPFDLSLNVQEKNNQIKFRITYNIALFDSSTIERMINHFQNILERVVNNLEEKIAFLPFLSLKEKEKMLVQWNQTNSNDPKEKSVNQLFEKQVEKAPNSIALNFQDLSLTYQELNQKANQLAHYLNKLDIKAEDKIGICLPRSLEMIIAIIGVLKTGAAYIPIDPNLPQKRIKNIINDSKIKVLISQEYLLDKFSNYPHKIVLLDQQKSLIEKESTENPVNNIKPNDLAYIIYTSGSTGKPKGVCIEHRSLSAFASPARLQAYHVNSDSRVLLFGSFSFSTSLSEIFMTLLTGATLYIVPQEDLMPTWDFVNILKKHRITNLKTTPSFLTLMPTQDIPDLKVITIMGEPSKLKVLNLWNKNRILLNSYGATEVSVCSTVGRYKSDRDKASIGHQVSNTKLYILDKYLQPVPIGVPGEIHITGIGIARGYLNQEKLTKSKFIKNPFGEGKLYKTGDLAYYLPNGDIVHLRRIDDQVKIRGFRIELGEIEANLAQHPDISQAIVIVKEKKSKEPYLLAYIVVNKNKKLNSLQLREYLTERLPNYMIPSSFVYLDSFPLTNNGKVDRQALPEASLDFHDEDLFVAPRNAIEKTLSQIWEELLTINKVGINDNFFDLGGHSLLATQIVSRINQQFNLDLPLRYLFELPTIAQLSSVIDKLSSSQEKPLLSKPQIDSMEFGEV